MIHVAKGSQEIRPLQKLHPTQHVQKQIFLQDLLDEMEKRILY